jgi:hypothetical protein
MTARRLAVAGTAAATALCLASPAMAQAPTGTLTFHEPANAGTFNIVDNAPKSRQGGARTRFSTKDALVFSNALQTGGKPAGTVRVTCYIRKAGTFATAKSDCVGIFGLATGNIYVSVLDQSFSSSTTDGTIVGGTGAYVGAKGTFHSVSNKNDTSDDTLTFTP